MDTVSRDCSCTFRGRQLVPGELSVPALDRNQSPLPVLFHFARSLPYFLYCSQGWRPAPEAHSSFLLLHLASAHPTFILLLRILVCIHLFSHLFHALYPAHSTLLHMLSLITQLVLTFALFTACDSSTRVPLFLFRSSSHAILALQVTIGSHIV
jgi:hypothetical protein